MDQRNLQKEMTGWTGQSCDFLNSLKKRLSKAESVDLIISFIMESGVRLLIDQLREINNLRILTGTYLGITQPWALRTLKEELPDAEIRLFDDPYVSFHPKAWIFRYGKSHPDEVIIGSSNLSRSALIEGVEWNCSLSGEDTELFKNRFEELFANAKPLTDDVLNAYSKSWTKPGIRLPKKLKDESDAECPSEIAPRDVQIEALYALMQARKNGVKRALIQAATGVGKTYLAAFDARGRNKILFVAHREEILRQAAKSFARVHPGKKQGFLIGGARDLDADILFASVMTLGKENWLKHFKPDHFDYIVIDEFHHAVADSYRSVIEYFQPEFMLGLTATPERLDGRDVYALCDYNVPYSITLQDAINKGILCPFRYYGIYDATDYSTVTFRNGRYSATELDALYKSAKNRTELILKHYRKHAQTRTLGFCSTQKHAEMMKNEFNKVGIPSMAVYSGSDDERSDAIRKLEEGKIQVLFSVDMFNEGVDIPDVDMVMMLRPTESPTVFLQQLGRGLRKAENKPFLTVLDFIGNYQNANKIPSFLEGGTSEAVTIETLRPPLDCYIDFDLELIDLFKEMEARDSRSGRNFSEKFRKEFDRIAELKGHRPTRMDLFEELDDELFRTAMKQGRKNPLHHYFQYLKDNDLLTRKEEDLWNSPVRELIEYLETTSMSKIYKMPVLQSFLKNGEILSHVSKEEMLRCWKDFFSENENWFDLIGMKSLGNIHTYEEFRSIPDKSHLNTMKTGPINFLDKSSKGLLQKDSEMGLTLNIDPKFLADSALYDQWKDILEFRTMEYHKNRLTQKDELYSVQ